MKLGDREGVAEVGDFVVGVTLTPGDVEVGCEVFADVGGMVMRIAM